MADTAPAVSFRTQERVAEGAPWENMDSATLVAARDLAVRVVVVDRSCPS